MKTVEYSQTRWFRWLLLLPAGLLLWWIGRALALGGPQQWTALAIAGLALAAPLSWAFLAKRVGAGVLTLEVPLVLLLLSTLTFRGRSAEELAVNPLDPAAQFRVAAVFLAGALGLFGLLWGRETGMRLTTLPFRLYMLYVVIVFAGAPLSVNPTLTAYRGVELAAGLVVLAGARRSLGQKALPRIEATIYWFTVALIFSVWFGYFAFRSEAIVQIQSRLSPFRLQLRGVYPSLASNTVGLLGVIVAAWSLGRARGGGGSHAPSPGMAYLLAGVGAASLLMSQYRTGYAALAATLAVLLYVRKKWVPATLLAGAALSIAIVAPSLLTDAQPYALRGQSIEQARELSGRLDFWRAAIPVWQKSPLIGRGLLTGTRFEVLQPLGFSFTADIHSTWVEALVGTGLVGVSLLGMSFLTTVRRATREALRRGWLTPLLLLTALTARSFTGSTIESFKHVAIVFLWLSLFMADRQDSRPSDAGNTHPAAQNSRST